MCSVTVHTSAIPWKDIRSLSIPPCHHDYNPSSPHSLLTLTLLTSSVLLFLLLFRPIPWYNNSFLETLIMDAEKEKQTIEDSTTTTTQNEDESQAQLGDLWVQIPPNCNNPIWLT